MPDPAVPPERLREYVTELAGTDPEAGITDLDPIVVAVGDARVVALGESTHGSRECFELKHRILRALVEERGLRAFAMEATVSDAVAVDDYVAYGQGDPVDALAGLELWPWKTEAVLDLVEWLRAFNADRPTDDRVRVYGFDVQFTDGPAAALRAFLDRADPAFLAEVDDGLRLLASDEVRGERYAVAADHLETAEAVVDALTDRFDGRAAEYAERTSRSEFDAAQRHLRTLERAVELARASHATADVRGAITLRDEFMAENVARLLDREGVDRVALWAHNGHLFRGRTEDAWDDFVPMGSHLADRFGDDYRVLGFDFHCGSFTATPDPETVDDPEPQTFSVGPFADDDRYADLEWTADPIASEALAGLDGDPLFVDLAAAADDPTLREWLDRRHPVRDVGGAYWNEGGHYADYRLPAEMDGLVFVEESTPTNVLGSESNG